MDYKHDVNTDAYDFLNEIEADIKEAIINGEEDISEIDCSESGYGEIRDYFHEAVVDRSYSIEDAAFVIANCENQETDTGLWEGRDMEEAMQVCAAYSYGADVWEEAERIYDELRDEFEPSWKVVDDAGDDVKEFDDEDDANDWMNDNDIHDGAGFEVTEGRGNIDELWKNYEADNTVDEIETGGMDELFVLKRWAKMAEKSCTWGGYQWGSVYIDARCGTGYSMPDVRDFYEYDMIARHKLPSMTGKYIDAVKERIADLEGKTAAPVRLEITLEGNTEDEITARLQHISARIGEGDTGSYDWKLTTRREG